MKQREIKFRAWQNGMTTQENSGVYGTKKFLDTLYEDCILMQYTGLKDKKGKEIYEGYIVEYEIYEDITFNKLKKVRREVNLCFCYHDNDFRPNNWLENIEVIGNIYENKDLLKE